MKNDLHAAIMNIPAEPAPDYSPGQQSAYKFGHKDARHAAAELAVVTAARIKQLEDALKFYADGCHFQMHDESAWETVSGEPPNFYEDESNTATVEDGSVAKMALEGRILAPADQPT